MGQPAYALQIGIGLHWRDVRIKILEDKDTMIVEGRSQSVQTTAEANTALALFIVGGEHWSKMTNQPLMPFWQVRYNKVQAMRRATSADRMYFADNGKTYLLPTKKVLQYEIQRASDGLEMMGYEKSSYNDFFEILRENVANDSPSEKMARAVEGHQRKRYTLRESLIFAAEDLKLL